LARATAAGACRQDRARADFQKNPWEKASGEFIDLGAIDSSRGRFEVRLDLGGGVLLHLVRS
jgi:hypothetical protein